MSGVATRGSATIYYAPRSFDLAQPMSIYDAAQMPRLTSIIESLWVRIGPSLNDLYPEFATSRVGVSNHMEAIA